MSAIKLDTLGGRHLVMAFLLTIDFILIQGIVRIFAIRRTISEGVSAAVRDPDMTYNSGSCHGSDWILATTVDCSFGYTHPSQAGSFDSDSTYG